MAPTYANIFMGQFEKKMLASFPHKPLVYFRYIGDIFMIWTEEEDILNQFINHCNSLNPSIQFEQTVSNTKIPFLDVNIIFENSQLTTDLYSNPTDKHQYLYYSSCHPKHTKTSLTVLPYVYEEYAPTKLSFKSALKKCKAICYNGDTREDA